MHFIFFIQFFFSSFFRCYFSILNELCKYFSLAIRKNLCQKKKESCFLFCFFCWIKWKCFRTLFAHFFLPLFNVWMQMLAPKKNRKVFFYSDIFSMKWNEEKNIQIDDKRLFSFCCIEIHIAHEHTHHLNWIVLFSILVNSIQFIFSIFNFPFPSSNVDIDYNNWIGILSEAKNINSEWMNEWM